MTDAEEQPAVPPFDGRGDERAGLFAAGGLLIVLGWGCAVLLNVLLHLSAPAGGHWVAGVYFGRSFGAYAWATVGLGAVTGALGLGVLGAGRAAPQGPIVLPGYPY